MNYQNWTQRYERCQPWHARRVPFVEPAPKGQEIVAWLCCALALGMLIFAALAA